MSILSYFADTYIKPIYYDLKRFQSRRCNAIVLYSERFNQVIYIKESKRKMKTQDMWLYCQRGINDIERVMKRELGKRQGRKQFIQVYKILIYLCPKVYKPIYRHIWALNKRGKGDYRTGNKTFNAKTYHMVFDTSEMQDNVIAGVIYKALYRKMNAQLESILSGLKQHKVTAFSSVKINVDDLTFSSHKLLSLHYQFTGKSIISPELEGEMKLFRNNLRKAKLEDQELHLQHKEVDDANR